MKFYVGEKLNNAKRRAIQPRCKSIDLIPRNNDPTRRMIYPISLFNLFGVHNNSRNNVISPGNESTDKIVTRNDGACIATWNVRVFSSDRPMKWSRRWKVANEPIDSIFARNYREFQLCWYFEFPTRPIFSFFFFSIFRIFLFAYLGCDYGWWIWM